MNRFKHNLSSEQLAHLLTEVSSDLLKTEKSEVTSRWFRAGDDLELFAWLNHDHELIRLQVVVFDQVVEWDLIAGLRTGFVEDPPPMLRAQKPSTLIVYDRQINAPTVTLVQKIILDSAKIEDRLRSKILQTIDRPIKIENVSLFKMIKNLFR